MRINAGQNRSFETISYNSATSKTEQFSLNCGRRLVLVSGFIFIEGKVQSASHGISALCESSFSELVQIEAIVIAHESAFSCICAYFSSYDRETQETHKTKKVSNTIVDRGSSNHFLRRPAVGTMAGGIHLQEAAAVTDLSKGHVTKLLIEGTGSPDTDISRAQIRRKCSGHS